MLRRTDIELASRKLINLHGEFVQFLADVIRKVGEHFGIDFQSRTLHAIEQGRQWQFDFGIDRFEILVEYAITQHVRSLSRQVSSRDSLPRGVGPISCGSIMVFDSKRLACKIVQLILAASRIEQVRSQICIVLDAFESDVKTVQQTNSALKIVNRLLNQTI